VFKENPLIEPITEKNISELLPLIRRYQEFYKISDISDAKNLAFFSPFGESNPLGCLFLFRENNEVVAFATVYFSFTSTIAAKIGVLNDMYTLPQYRGKGIGRKLIEHCRYFAEKHQAVRLQWVTTPDNEQAQELYYSLNTNKSTWFFYSYNTESEAP